MIRLLADVALVLTLSPAPVRPSVLPVLYLTHGVLQALDAHSTITALAGADTREGNPLLRGVVAHPPAFIAVKAASVVSTVLLAEYLWKRGYRRTAVVTVLVINVLMAGVVAHNYRY